MRDIPSKLNKYIRFINEVDKHFYQIKTWRYFKNRERGEVIENLGVYRELVRTEYTVIILGRPGPTGKTWLATKLLEQGYRAIDISELPEVYRNITFREDCKDEDYFGFDDDKKVVIVMLNKPVITFDKKIHYEKGEN